MTASGRKQDNAVASTFSSRDMRLFGRAGLFLVASHIGAGSATLGMSAENLIELRGNGMRRRLMRGIPSIAPDISFGNIDENPFAPLHRRLGIVTYERLQAVTDYVGGFNQETGQYFSPHEYRARVTLPKVIA